MQAPLHISGYAAVSEDGMLANGEGVMPQVLKVDADQCFFKHQLELADVLVHGRHSAESDPSSSSKHRLIVTRQVQATAPHPSGAQALLWNPAGASLLQALTALGPPNTNIAILGATTVFEIFLNSFENFFVSRVANVQLPGGRPVFASVPALSPEQVLADHGMARGSNVLSTPEVTITQWWRRTPCN
jgi:dihydrofolate reductase